MPQIRRPAAVNKPVVLTIAGSDSGGGAGVQADLKTIEACGGFGVSAVTAVTAQNTQGVESSFVLPVEELTAQIDAIRTDFDVATVKTGMLATSEVIETVTAYAREFRCPVVVDPVMVAASGDRLLEPDAEVAYEDLLAEATLATPNADEVAVLTGLDPTDESEARTAGERLLETGCEAVLVKGGHIPGDDVRDVLVTGTDEETFRHPRVDTAATHGSGCALASAIATHLARGEGLSASVREATNLLARAVRYPHDVGEGPGAVHHLVGLRNEAARHPTAEAVEGLVERFVDQDVSALVPEVGMNVVGATPYAEETGETAAVEGRITRTLTGVNPNRGVRFGASSHVARFLLEAREFQPDLRFGVNCRFDAEVERALDALNGSVTAYDRDDEPPEVKDSEGTTMQWAARQVFGGDESPVVVVDRGEVGKEAMTKIIAPTAETLAGRVQTVLDALNDRP